MCLYSSGAVHELNNEWTDQKKKKINGTWSSVLFASIAEWDLVFT